MVQSYLKSFRQPYLLLFSPVLLYELKKVLYCRHVFYSDRQPLGYHFIHEPVELTKRGKDCRKRAHRNSARQNRMDQHPNDDAISRHSQDIDAEIDFFFMDLHTKM